MNKLAFALVLTLLPALSARSGLGQTAGGKKQSAPQLIALAEANSPDLRDDILATFSDKDLKAGKAWIAHGPDFFFAIESSGKPELVIDHEPTYPPREPAQEQAARRPMKSLQGDGDQKLWYASAHIEPVGKVHAFHYWLDGADFGGSLDLPAFGPLHYAQPGVPQGKLSAKLTHTSKIYDGMKSNYWIYVPAEYDPKTPAALMVFQDGEGYTNRDGGGALNEIDNLIAQKKIPVMICVFVNPGSVMDAPGTPTYIEVKAHGERFHRDLNDAMRSTLYDTVSDRYDRFLRDELLAEVGKQYNIRKDAYSRAITGLSSGGICSFNAAWQLTGSDAQFSRVITWIGSFTNIQWKEQPYAMEGGQDYPDKILREPHRNIRVWLQDGSNDMENPNWGSWPLANIRMANALKTREYDFHFSFGKGTHNAAHGSAEFPEEMVWLWRDYDPAKTEQTYQMDPAEKNKPFFRVAITSRAAD